MGILGFFLDLGAWLMESLWVEVFLFVWVGTRVLVDVDICWGTEDILKVGENRLFERLM